MCFQHGLRLRLEYHYCMGTDISLISTMSEWDANYSSDACKQTSIVTHRVDSKAPCFVCLFVCLFVCHGSGGSQKKYSLMKLTRRRSCGSVAAR